MDTKVAAQSLGRVLADSYVLMLKTQNVHWHVVGGTFVGIHNLTEQQYNDLFMAVDEIAERIRALGEIAPGTLTDYLDLSRLTEGLGGNDDAAMVRGLVEAHSKMSELLRKEIDILDDIDDYGSEDLLIGRLRVHEKAAWMLKSILTQISAGKATVAAPTPVAKVEEPKIEKPVKKEKKKEKKAKEEAISPKKEGPLPFKEPAKKEEVASVGGRRKLFGVKADG